MSGQTESRWHELIDLSQKATRPGDAQTPPAVTQEVETPMPDKPTKRQDLEPRFWVKVDKRGPDECWPWCGTRSDRGYGNFKLDGKSVKAHRVAFVLATGIEPGKRIVHHRCENKNCVNPAHLGLMSHVEHSRLHLTGSPLHRDGSSKKAKLTAEQVVEIRASSLTYRELGEIYGVAPSTIGAVRTWVTWK